MSIIQKDFAQSRRVGRVLAEEAERAITQELGLKAAERIYEPDSIVLEEGNPVTSIKLLKSGYLRAE